MTPKAQKKIEKLDFFKIKCDIKHIQDSEKTAHLL